MKKFINKKPFFIAEISANHCGSFEKAKKLIILAKKNGADAVKLQTYTPDMMTIKNNKFLIKDGVWKNINLGTLYKNGVERWETGSGGGSNAGSYKQGEGGTRKDGEVLQKRKGKEW